MEDEDEGISLGYYRGPSMGRRTGDNLAQLRALLEQHADPEIAIELRVVDAEGWLVEAPDVGDNEIWVSTRLPTESIEALRTALSGNLRP